MFAGVRSAGHFCNNVISTRPTFESLGSGRRRGLWVTWAETWRRVWGDENIFRGPEWHFSGKNVNFISDDLLFFSHRPGFSDFTLLYSIKCRIRPFLHQKNHYFGKEFLDRTIFYSVRTFARIRQHYFSKYWGDQCMGRPPTSNFFGGPSPQSPPRSPPLLGDQVQHITLPGNVTRLHDERINLLLVSLWQNKNTYMYICIPSFPQHYLLNSI